MLNQLAQQYLEYSSPHSALILLQVARLSEAYKVGYLLGKHFFNLYPAFPQIGHEFAQCAQSLKKHREAHTIYEKLFRLYLEQETIEEFRQQASLSIPFIKNRYIYYPSERIAKLAENSDGPVVFSVTTCKRFDLFIRTINSFINCCLDLNLIGKWICVDDNSSKDDREKMKGLYPFFDFVFKGKDQKGHPISMNIIRHKAICSGKRYIFHMEDDFQFFSKRKYLTECLEILDQDPSIGECLINRNYAETEVDTRIKGGIPQMTPQGTRYYIHELCQTRDELEAFLEKHGKHTFHCTYWRHFSFRPALHRLEVWQKIGAFNRTAPHFEREYAYRYVDHGYFSVFLEHIYTLHIGRLTSERDDGDKTNAYELNNETQFEEKPVSTSELKFKTYVINLDRRSDRWEKFQKEAEKVGWTDYERFPAIDGKRLVSTPQLRRIFDGNDYRSRKSALGCALSHLTLMVELINSDYDCYIHLEDDIELVPEFPKKLQHVFQQLQSRQWDLCFLAHFLFPNLRTAEFNDPEKMPTIEQWDRATSLGRSMGGTIGFIITREGARKFLDFIDQHGMVNCIDTMIQKSADTLNVWYCTPHLLYSECFLAGMNQVDSDIQYDFDSLDVDLDQRLEIEKEFFHGELDEVSYEEGKRMCEAVALEDSFYIRDEPLKIRELEKLCIHPHYTLEPNILIVVPNPSERVRYFHRFKKGDKYSLEDAIKYE